jgi:hypothetical protein
MLNNAHIRIIGPDERGGYVLQFWKHTGQCLAFVVPPNADNDVLPYFQERMPYGLAVPDVDGAEQAENDVRFADRRCKKLP